MTKEQLQTLENNLINYANEVLTTNSARRCSEFNQAISAIQTLIDLKTNITPTMISKE